MTTMTREETEALIAEVLEVYPAEAREDRAKHLTANDASADKSSKCITSNRKSLPGVMTIRGCAYAGSKGVVWGPIKDMIHISHGPVGCGQYSRAGRRNYYVGTTGVNTFGTMNFTSDFQEKDIVFGGDKKLAKLIGEIETLFPLNKGISVQSECPIGLIGDDIEAVSKKANKEINKPVVPVRCEGFRGVSQSLGHHIANDAIRDWVFDGKTKKEREFVATPYDVAIIGDYNIGGDAWSSRILLEEIGLRVIAQWSGDGTIAELGADVVPAANDEVIDGRGTALVPGLVNGHTHAAMTLMRGLADDRVVAPLRTEPHRQLLRTVAHEAGVARQFRLGDGQGELGEAGEQPLQGDGRLHPGQRCAQAVVRAVAEREVARRGAAGEVEAVRVHDLHPGGCEVTHELLLGVVSGVHLGDAAQDGVRPEDQVDRGGRPVPALVDAGFGCGRLPLPADLEQVDEEVVR